MNNSSNGSSSNEIAPVNHFKERRLLLTRVLWFAGETAEARKVPFSI